MTWQPDIGEIVIAWHDGRWRIGNVIRVHLDELDDVTACEIFDLVSESMFTATYQNTYSVHDHAPKAVTS